MVLLSPMSIVCFTAIECICVCSYVAVEYHEIRRKEWATLRVYAEHIIFTTCDDEKILCNICLLYERERKNELHLAKRINDDLFGQHILFCPISYWKYKT